MKLRHALLICLFAGFSAIVAAQNTGPDWPQWRGRVATAHSPITERRLRRR